MGLALEVKNLSYVYPDGTQALNDVSFQVEEGECIGIIGHNGAGKSTLLFNLNGILRGKGSIKVFEKELNDRNLMEIRKIVGVVFQDPDDQLFCPTVFEDVAFGPINLGLSKEEVEKRVKKALELVGMQGYEKRSSHHLSFGEKKRIALATVLAMEPRILALDEPTSNLDPRAREELLKLLKNLKITKIVASHDIEAIAELCNRVIILYKGKVVASGSAEEILANEALLKLYELSPPTIVKLFKSAGYNYAPLTLNEGIKFLRRENGRI